MDGCGKLFETCTVLAGVVTAEKQLAALRKDSSYRCGGATPITPIRCGERCGTGQNSGHVVLPSTATANGGLRVPLFRRHRCRVCSLRNQCVTAHLPTGYQTFRGRHHDGLVPVPEQPRTSAAQFAYSFIVPPGDPESARIRAWRTPPASVSAADGRLSCGDRSNGDVNGCLGAALETESCPGRTRGGGCHDQRDIRRLVEVLHEVK